MHLVWGTHFYFSLLTWGPPLVDQPENLQTCCSGVRSMNAPQISPRLTHSQVDGNFNATVTTNERAYERTAEGSDSAERLKHTAETRGEGALPAGWVQNRAKVFVCVLWCFFGRTACCGGGGSEAMTVNTQLLSAVELVLSQSSVTH